MVVYKVFVLILVIVLLYKIVTFKTASCTLTICTYIHMYISRKSEGWKLAVNLMFR